MACSQLNLQHATCAAVNYHGQKGETSTPGCQHVFFGVTTYIFTRDTRPPPIPPLVMALSAMGSIWGSSGVLPTTRKNKRKTNAFTIFGSRAAFFALVCLHAQTAAYAGNTCT